MMQTKFSTRKASFDGLNIRYIASAGVFRDAKEDDVEQYLNEASDRDGIGLDGFYFEKLTEGYKLLVF